MQSWIKEEEAEALQLEEDEFHKFQEQLKA